MMLEDPAVEVPKAELARFSLAEAGGVSPRVAEMADRRLALRFLHFVPRAALDQGLVRARRSGNGRRSRFPAMAAVGTAEVRAGNAYK